MSNQPHRATTTVPGDALALGIQDNQAVLRALMRHAPALAQALRASVGDPMGDQAEQKSAIPNWMRQARAQVAPLLDALAGWAAAAVIPTSVGTLTLRDGDAVLAGQDLAVGALILPGLALAVVESNGAMKIVAHTAHTAT